MGNSPPQPPGIGTHYMRYSITNVLVLVAGFVSFPVLTRLLDNTQYGILGYYDTWMMLAIATAKLGAQHAILRFYPVQRDPQRMEHFGTNLVLLPTLLSLTLWALAAAFLFGYDRWGDRDFSPMFWCVVLIVPTSLVASMVQMVMRAGERSGLVMATRVIGRWLELGLVLGAVIMLDRSALSVFGGKLAAGVLLLCYFVYWTRRNLKFSRGAVDFPAMKEGMGYSLPLMANEFAAVVWVTIDRVLLKEMTGDFASVGIYVIGYSLAMQVNVFMNATLMEAFAPVVNRTYGTGGDTAVLALKDRVLLPMTYASVGVAAMLLSVGEEALVALSGPSKSASGIVFVVVGTTLALFPLFDISSYGLLLRKRSMRVFGTTLVAAVLNIGVNLVLIPPFGYMGAVWATVISYVALCGLRYLWCPRELLRFPKPRTLGNALGCAVLLLVVVKGSDLFGAEGPWLRLIVAGGLFLLLYALPVWLLDSRLRQTLMTWRTAAA